MLALSIVAQHIPSPTAEPVQQATTPFITYPTVYTHTGEEKVILLNPVPSTSKPCKWIMWTGFLLDYFLVAELFLSRL